MEGKLKTRGNRYGRLITGILVFVFMACGNFEESTGVVVVKNVDYKWERTCRDLPPDTTNSKKGELPDIPGRNGNNCLEIFLRFPEGDFSKPALFIPNLYETMEVFVIGKNQKTAKIASVDSSGYGKWELVSLEKSIVKNTIGIRFASNNRFLIGPSMPIRAGNRNAIINWILMTNTSQISVGLINLLLAVIVFLGFLIVKERIFFYMSLLNLSLGIYFLSTTYTIHLIVDNAKLVYMVWEISIIISAILVKYYLESLFGKQGILEYWLWAFLLFLGLKYTINGFGSFDGWTITLNLGLSALLLLCLFITIRLYLAGNREAAVFGISFFVLFVLGVYNSFGNHFHFMAESNMHYGMTVIILSSGYASIKRHYELLEANQRLVMEKKSNETDLAELGLRNFTEKTSPEFLLKNLISIKNNILENPEISDLGLRYLSDTYRYITDNLNESLVGIFAELEYTISHLNLENIEEKIKPDLEILVPTNLNAVKIPPLTIQPLVEMYLRQRDKPGLIRISGRQVRDGISLGISSDKRGKVAEKKDGNLLKYTKERLEFYYEFAAISLNNQELTIEFFNRKQKV